MTKLLVPLAVMKQLSICLNFNTYTYKPMHEAIKSVVTVKTFLAVHHIAKTACYKEAEQWKARINLPCMNLIVSHTAFILTNNKLIVVSTVQLACYKTFAIYYTLTLPS